MHMKDLKVIISPGSIVKYNREVIIDQLSGEKIPLKKFDDYLMSKYSLTTEEYYNLVVNGDKTFVPKCECGSQLRFNRGNICHPYKKYCSTQCGNKYRRPSYLVDKEFISRLSNTKGLEITKTVPVNGTSYEVIWYGRIFIQTDIENWIVDQLSGVGVFERNLDDYFRDTYGITREQYYNYVVEGTPHTSRRCNYRYCSKTPVFHGLRDGYSKYCCISHEALEQFESGSHPFQSPNLIDSNREKILNGSSNLHSEEPEARRFRTVFLDRCSKYNHTEATLYIASYTDSSEILKIGITTDSVSSRMNNSKCRTSGKYKSIHRIVVSNPEVISNLEYLIKLKYCSKILHSTEDFEFIKLREVLEFIKKELNNTCA